MLPARRTLLLGAAALALSAGCSTLGSGSGAWERVADRRWHLTEIEGAPALEGVSVTLELEGTTRLFGSGGVNRYFGSCERAGRDGLAIGRLATTRMAGPPDAMRQEERFLQLLEGVDAFESDGDVLSLKSGGRTVLRFSSKPVLEDQRT